MRFIADWQLSWFATTARSVFAGYIELARYGNKCYEPTDDCNRGNFQDITGQSVELT